MFTQFITDRLLKSSQEPEILVFDEYIKLKLNRSKLKFVKEDTKFLNVSDFFYCKEKTLNNTVYLNRMNPIEFHKSFGLHHHPIMLLLVKENVNDSPQTFNFIASNSWFLIP